MPFADLALSQRLERTEGEACVQFVEARRRLAPEFGAAWIRCAGAYAAFDGVDSPITQTFGLGIFEPLTPESLDEIERFFFERGAAANHEVSPHAGTQTLELLCSRGYKPIEISNVLYRPIDAPASESNTDVSARAIHPSEALLWSDISAKGWSHEHPELFGFLQQIGGILAARANSVCFLGEVDGRPGAAGALSIHDGVALFAGSATIPELRRRGLQGALLRERMRYAHQHGCDLAMMVALAGSDSQRNAERKGFHVAYTRIKWSAAPPGTDESVPRR